MPTSRSADEKKLSYGSKVWLRIRPYLATVLFSLGAALLVVAFVGDTLTSWKAALLAGYTVDSTLQKISTGNWNAGDL